MIIHSDISGTFLNGITVGEGGSVTVRTDRHGDFSATVSAQDCLPQTYGVFASLGRSGPAVPDARDSGVIEHLMKSAHMMKPRNRRELLSYTSGGEWRQATAVNGSKKITQVERLFEKQHIGKRRKARAEPGT